VSAEYTPAFEFTGGRIVKVVIDVGADRFVDVERHMAARDGARLVLPHLRPGGDARRPPE
jgi:hypothetical protein